MTDCLLAAEAMTQVLTLYLNHKLPAAIAVLYEPHEVLHHVVLCKVLEEAGLVLITPYHNLCQGPQSLDQ